jgi:hypothetical protein
VSVYAFILVGGLERFIVLVGVEAITERQKVDNDLRHELEETEAYVHSLKAKLAKCSTGTDTDPVNAHTTPGDSDTGATQRPWPWSNGQGT